MEKIITLVYLAFILVMSLIAVVLYASDKKKAKRGAWRTPEAVLLGFGFFGGAIGALLAMKGFRHKTKHWYFWAVNIISLALHIALIIFSSQMNIF